VSRIGKLPVPIPKNVTVDLQENNYMVVKGPKGQLERQLHPKINIEVKENEVVVTRQDDSKFSRSLHGLTRQLIANMIDGVSKGFTKKLQIIGVGYRAEMKGKKLVLTLGYSHPIVFSAPESITITTPSPTEILISGIDKELVGLIAAKIRSFRKPEPYKGKGVRYENEYVRRKAGKAAGK